MNNRFVIDIGNSLVKIAYADIGKSKIISKKSYGAKKLNEYSEEIIKQLSECKNTKIYIASIAPKTLETLLLIINNTHEIIIIKNELFKSISCDSFNLNEIGIDILASSYKALKIHKKSLLISCGTAIFASLNFSQKLQGVLIMPSIMKAFSDLSLRCELINDFELLNYNKEFGSNTNESITGGYFHMLHGTFQSIIKYANEKHGINSIIICGGNHKNVQNLIFDKNIHLDFSMPDIVILGIIEIIKDNKL